MHHEEHSGLSLKLFGAFEARLSGVPMLELQAREGERLLVLLVLNQGYVQQGAVLASTLWPETGSLDSLRTSVGHVRAVLGVEGARLATPRGGILINLEGADVDVIAFDRAVASSEMEGFEQAVALYRGPLLQGWEERYPADKPWVLRAREKRKEKFREALKAVSRAHMARGNYEIAAAYLKQYVAAFSADEWAWCDWMRALVELGERVGAINLFSTCRKFFEEKHHLPPPAPVFRLYQQLQQGTPTRQVSMPEDQARLEPAGGAVPLDSSYYIVRGADHALEAAISRRDGLVLLKGPRQTGKTSLLARGLQQARTAGSLVIVTDFQRISSQHWANADAFLMALARSVTEQLDLDAEPQSFWRSGDGPNENFDRYMKREVLKKVPTPLVWGMDEVDRLFAYPFRNDTFGLFRSWYNDRALNPNSPWHRLTLALVYATEAHLFITDLNQSPFNVGTRLALEDFTIEQVCELNMIYGNPLQDPDTTARFYECVGGNPYLVRQGLEVMVAHEWDLPTFEAQAHQENGCYGDHLQRMWHALEQDCDLTEMVQGLLRGNPCTSTEGFYRLRSAGILTGCAPEAARFRCRIYETYLGARLK